MACNCDCSRLAFAHTNRSSWSLTPTRPIVTICHRSLRVISIPRMRAFFVPFATKVATQRDKEPCLAHRAAMLDPPSGRTVVAQALGQHCRGGKSMEVVASDTLDPAR